MPEIAVSLHLQGSLAFFNLWKHPLQGPMCCMIAAVSNVESVGRSVCCLPVGHTQSKELSKLNRCNQINPSMYSVCTSDSSQPCGYPTCRRKLLGLACWMDPTGFRIHISINSVARIQYCQGRLVTGLVLWSMLSIMQHIGIW